ncbi:hypothetical protein [Agromyces sp. PvR057]|uniref:hypothetical protein n=1 Tax=Agromyces sp. PvR057 TaxID=3156403 RepID=UPI003397E767
MTDTTPARRAMEAGRKPAEAYMARTLAEARMAATLSAARRALAHTTPRGTR